MNMHDRSPYLSKPEFSFMMWIVWVFLMIIMIRMPQKTITDSLLRYFALGMVIFFALRSMRTDYVNAEDLPPLSEKCQEIARDPARKIEAIKCYREENAESLYNAKQAVEFFIATQKV